MQIRKLTGKLTINSSLKVASNDAAAGRLFGAPNLTGRDARDLLPNLDWLRLPWTEEGTTAKTLDGHTFSATAWANQNNESKLTVCAYCHVSGLLVCDLPNGCVPPVVDSVNPVFARIMFGMPVEDIEKKVGLTRGVNVTRSCGKLTMRVATCGKPKAIVTRSQYVMFVPQASIDQIKLDAVILLT